MAVPPEVIDEIRNRIDIVRVIGDSVPLKKSGRNYVGLCPFHQEKSPSFTVSDQKQLYHCFGCGEGGTVITYFMKYHRLTFPETLERMASMAGMDLSQYRQEAKEIAAYKEKKQKLHRVLTYARDFYHHLFMESPLAAGARDYVAARGITIEQVRLLQIGFAPSGWQTLFNGLIKDQQPVEDALASGLIAKKQKEEGFYDVFRERVLFPIDDPKGNPAGFGGRVMGEGTPKYLNSSQTPVFDKGKLLYGLYAAEEAIRREKKLVVVEGYMDQVALRFAGVENAVATLGTALTEHHAQLIQKYSDEVIVVFDGDEAGIKAARRSMRPLLSQGLRAKVVILPDKHDPDSFVRKEGRKAFVEFMEQAQPMLEFFVKRFFQDESDVSKKAQAIEELAKVIQGTENVYLKEAILNEAAKMTGLSSLVLRGDGKPRMAVASAYKSPVPETVPSPRVSDFPFELWMLLRLAAEIPAARRRLLSNEVLSLTADDVFIGKVKAWLSRMDENASDVVSASVVDHWDDETTRPFLTKAFVAEELSNKETWEQVYADCVRKLRKLEIRRLYSEVKVADERGEDQQVLQLLKRMEELKRLDQGGER